MWTKGKPMGLDESSISWAEAEDERVQLVDSFDLEELRALDPFQALVEAAASVSQAPLAVVALVDRRHIHTVSTVGLSPRSRPRTETLGGEIIERGHTVVVEDFSKEERFGGFVPAIEGRALRFYFGQPLMIDNSIAVGTLSLMDFEPRRVSVHQRAVLSSIVRQIELQLEYILRKRDSLRDSGLAAEAATAHHVDARRQVLTNFLLHDVINAATAVKADADFVRARSVGGPDVSEALDDIAVAVDSMANLLHSAREILLEPDATFKSFDSEVDLRGILEEVGAHHRAHLSQNQWKLEVSDKLRNPVVSGQRKLLVEMFDSLLAVSLASSPPGSTIELEVVDIDDQNVQIALVDAAEPMSDPVKRRLLGRDEGLLERTDVDSEVVRDSVEALSLCNMIVEAHGGMMRVEDVDHGRGGRRFRIHLPR